MANSNDNLNKTTKIIFSILSTVIVMLFVIHTMALTIRLAIGEFLCQKPSLEGLIPINSTETDVNFNRLFDILLISVGVLHIPENIYLLVFLFRFLAIYKSWEISYKLALRIKMREFVITKRRSVFFGLVLLIFFLVALTIPSLCIYRSYIINGIPKYEKCHKALNKVALSLTIVYHSVSIFTNIVVWLERCMMIFFTIMVGVMWRKVQPIYSMIPFSINDTSTDENRSEENENQSEENEIQSEENENRSEENVREYLDTRNRVTHIYKIFESFFVLQWLIHLFGLFCHIAYLMRPWIRHGQVTNADVLIASHQIYQFFYILYDGLAITTAHVCALKMNTYFEKYTRDNQQSEKENLCISHLIKSRKIPTSEFEPRIPGTGLRISINSPGFVLSVILSVFALIGALVAF